MSEGSQASFIVEDDMLDANVTETYMGEWKNDKRCGFGISERSDGLKYEGEWFNNRKYGYGVTTFKDGSREEGKYKNNILITSNKKKHLFLIRSAKFRERIDSAVNAAQRASKIALQKADIAISRTATARGKAEQADYAAVCAREDSSEARSCAQNFAPEFQQPDGSGGPPGVHLLQQEPEMKMDLRASLAAPAVKPQLDKLQMPGGGPAGPGPPSPRGGMTGPPTPTTAPPPPVANHVGPPGSVINKSPVPNPGLDVRTNNPSTVPRVTPIPSPKPPAPAPAPQPPPQAKPVPSRAPPKALSPQLTSEPPKQNNTVSDIQRIPEPAPPKVNKMGAAPTIAAPPPRTEVPQPQFPDPSVMRQPHTLQVSEPAASRGRTPTRQERSRLSAQNDTAGSGPPPAGGYNFQKIMDDRFEHYKRPPSRERSTDRFGAGSRQGSRQQLSRDTSRDRAGPARPQSRQRTPMTAQENSFSENNNSGLDSLNLDSAAPAHTGNGAVGGSFSPDFKLPAEDQIRFRGVQQEIPHFGAPPKRTESLYMKAGDNQQATFKVLGSSARREEIRRQLDEAERYRANPILYIFNPHIREWFSRQQLMMVVLFVNVTLAIMFFKLLT